jgi:hypothetical protein
MVQSTKAQLRGDASGARPLDRITAGQGRYATFRIPWARRERYAPARIGRPGDVKSRALTIHTIHRPFARQFCMRLRVGGCNARGVPGW